MSFIIYECQGEEGNLPSCLKARRSRYIINLQEENADRDRWKKRGSDFIMQGRIKEREGERERFDFRGRKLKGTITNVGGGGGKNNHSFHPTQVERLEAYSIVQV